VSTPRWNVRSSRLILLFSFAGRSISASRACCAWKSGAAVAASSFRSSVLGGCGRPFGNAAAS
jgi:hypothetical protein